MSPERNPNFFSAKILTLTFEKFSLGRAKRKGLGERNFCPLERGGKRKLYKLAARPGFEPRLMDPESIVLPLDDLANCIVSVKYYKTKKQPKKAFISYRSIITYN